MIRLSVTRGDVALTAALVAIAISVGPIAWRSVARAAQDYAAAVSSSAWSEPGLRLETAPLGTMDDGPGSSPADAIAARPADDTPETARARLLDRLTSRALFGMSAPSSAALRPETQAPPSAPALEPAPPPPRASAPPKPPLLTLRGVVETANGMLALAEDADGRAMRLRIGDEVASVIQNAKTDRVETGANWRVMEIRRRALVLARGDARHEHRLTGAAAPRVSPKRAARLPVSSPTAALPASSLVVSPALAERGSRDSASRPPADARPRPIPPGRR